MKALTGVLLFAIFFTCANGLVFTGLRHYFNQFFQFFGDSHFTTIKIDPEVNMNAAQLIRSKGYPCIEYKVQTADGFILGLQRIPYGRNAKNKNGKKQVAFLQHGLLTASTNWITNLANESLAFILADAGYDVWLGNMRGNTYSKEHVKYSIDSDEFWDWTWYEMAAYDLPAMINFATHTTGQKDLFYIGHSQGSLIAFTQLSRDKELAKKIKLFVALGPVAYLGNMKSPLKYLAWFAPEMRDIFRIFGVRDFMPNDEFMKFLARFVCDTETRVFCECFIFLISGFDAKQLNDSRLPVYVAHAPAGTSVKNMVHYSQMYETGRFQNYDYGSIEKNQKHYGQSYPPQFHPENITTPMALFSGKDDWLADPKDVNKLKRKLKSLKYFTMIDDWDHLDFIWAMDAKKVVYDKVMALLKKYR